ncbi:MAG: hypothetical protein II799_00750 [Lachnospiraceae bacterium]|nr:hypothetical protein [Lachnospiraceae bacterium]
MVRLFKKKTIGKLSSPEQLNEYIRVTTPSVWLLLTVLLLLLTGLIAWSVTGRVEVVGSDGAVKQIRPIELVIN